MKQYIILPAILEQTAEDALKKLQTAQTFSDWVQWDIMDGKFVSNKTWYDAQIVERWKIRTKIELHIMANDPARIIEQWQKVAKFKRVIWHVEAPIDHADLIRKCHDMGKEVGLAISPNTSLLELTPFLEFLETVLVMSVEPGKSGQELLPQTYERVKKVHDMKREADINVDGGVNAKNITRLAQAGANHFTMNSAIFQHAFPADFVKGQLQKIEALGLKK